MTSAGVSLTQALSSSLPWSAVSEERSGGGEALSHLAEKIPHDITISFIKAGYVRLWIVKKAQSFYDLRQVFGQNGTTIFMPGLG